MQSSFSPLGDSEQETNDIPEEQVELVRLALACTSKSPEYNLCHQLTTCSGFGTSKPAIFHVE